MYSDSNKWVLFIEFYMNSKSRVNCFVRNHQYFVKFAPPMFFYPPPKKKKNYQ